MIRSLLLSVLSLLLLFNCKPKKTERPEEVIIPWSVARIFPHDKKSFIEGLTIDKGRLFESTGEDKGWIAEVDIASGKQEKKVILDTKYFGEGITILNDKIYQLTWKNHTGFIYDVKTFAKKGEFSYSFEGWGLTHDGKNLIASDGTEKLHFLDTTTLKEKSVVSVHNGYGPVQYLNELEFIDGFIFANLWQSNFILKIDPTTGEVVGKMDLTKIVDKIKLAEPNIDVLNGIAYEKKSKLMLVTGKYWPNLFALRLQKVENSQ